jgi:hypothetical protein
MRTRKQPQFLHTIPTREDLSQVCQGFLQLHLAIGFSSVNLRLQQLVVSFLQLFVDLSLQLARAKRGIQEKALRNSNASRSLVFAPLRLQGIHLLL